LDKKKRAIYQQDDLGGPKMILPFFQNQENKDFGQFQYGFPSIHDGMCPGLKVD
jgi:hypothetical protein